MCIQSSDNIHAKEKQICYFSCFQKEIPAFRSRITNSHLNLNFSSLIFRDFTSNLHTCENHKFKLSVVDNCILDTSSGFFLFRMLR